MVKVLIVDDSKVVQEFLVHILTSDPDIRIVGVASSGSEAIELVAEKHPDVITMDYHMPDMDGSEATSAIMQSNPTPIVIVSGSMGTSDVTRSFSLIEDGALSVVLRPPGPQDPDFVTARKELIQTVKLMSEVKVVRRFRSQQTLRKRSSVNKPAAVEINNEIQLLAIGASTGGPAALQKVLSGLPKDFSIPVLIVQHISTGFINGFVDWLSATSGIKLRIPSDGEKIKAGTGYIAPDNFHMGIRHGKHITLSSFPPENGLRPSVNFLFRSVAEVVGRDSIGVLLTGMGKDGAETLKTMREKGAITIAQDEESSVIFGMPGEAIKIGAAAHVLHIDNIAGFVTRLVKK